MKNMPDAFAIYFACLQISSFETVILFSFWAITPNKIGKHAQVKHFPYRSAKHARNTTARRLKRLNLAIKSQAFLTGRFSCVGVALKFSSFGRNCVATFPWPDCFKSMLAYVIHPQNTKNPSCVGARCSLW